MLSIKFWTLLPPIHPLTDVKLVQRSSCGSSVSYFCESPIVLVCFQPANSASHRSAVRSVTICFPALRTLLLVYSEHVIVCSGSKRSGLCENSTHIHLRRVSGSHSSTKYSAFNVAFRFLCRLILAVLHIKSKSEFFL